MKWHLVLQRTAALLPWLSEWGSLRHLCLADCGAWAWAAIQGLCLYVLPFDLLGLMWITLSGPKEVENPRNSVSETKEGGPLRPSLGYFSGLATPISACPTPLTGYIFTLPSVPSA